MRSGTRSWTHDTAVSGALAQGGEVVAGESLSQTVRQQMAQSAPAVTQFPTPRPTGEIREFSIKSQMTAMCTCRRARSLGMQQCSHHREWSAQERACSRPLPNALAAQCPARCFWMTSARASQLLEAEHIAHLGHWELDITTRKGKGRGDSRYSAPRSNNRPVRNSSRTFIPTTGQGPRRHRSVCAMVSNTRRNTGFAVRMAKNAGCIEVERHLDDSGGLHRRHRADITERNVEDICVSPPTLSRTPRKA